MSSTPKVTPKDFFLWLGAMATLYVSVVSLITLLFQYINVLFPDELNASYIYDPYSGPIRFAIASLIVIFPLYIFLTRWLNQNIRSNPEKKDLWVRRWLIYITLFIGGITLVVDLIWLINDFLSGELTTQFLLKILSIFIIIGGAFVYYTLDLRGYWESRKSVSQGIGFAVSILVLISIVSGFFIIGSPQTAREIRFDQERVSGLQNIQWQIVQYWQDREELPGDLSALEDSISGFAPPRDPETGDPYQYRVTDELTFELCATFNQPRPNGTVTEIARPVAPEFGITKNDNWEHDAGRTCFERTIDPERYPPRERE